MRLLPIAFCAALTGCPSGGERAVAPSASAVSGAMSTSRSPATAATAPARPALPRRGVATCVLEGRFAIRANEPLSLGENGDVKARFTGHVIQMRMESIDTRDATVASGTVRAATTAPAMLLAGKVGADALPIHAARDIAIAGSHVVIPLGQALAVVAGEETTLGVRARYGDFDGLDTPASCDQIALGEKHDRFVVPPGTRMHLVRERAPLFTAPNGAVVIELHVRRRSPTVSVAESRDGFHHVRYDDGVRIDGWMRAADLAPGDGPDCDDCHGDVMDVEDSCPAGKGCPDAKGGPFHARRRVAVRDRPHFEGQPLGWLEEDGEVRIVERRSGYARVEALNNEVAAPSSGFWIDEATLDPRGK